MQEDWRCSKLKVLLTYIWHLFSLSLPPTSFVSSSSSFIVVLDDVLAAIVVSTLAVVVLAVAIEDHSFLSCRELQKSSSPSSLNLPLSSMIEQSQQ